MLVAKNGMLEDASCDPASSMWFSPNFQGMYYLRCVRRHVCQKLYH
jgi:hypothetical protein